MGDFHEVQESFSVALKELLPKLNLLKPKGLVHLVPVFDGGLTESRISEARAALSATEAAGKQTGQTIRFEVRASLLAVREAGARISAAELLVRQAEENLTLAEGRYETGVGSVLEVADAILAANSAQVSLFQAKADYSTSLAALEKTLGGEFQ